MFWIMDLQFLHAAGKRCSFLVGGSWILFKLDGQEYFSQVWVNLLKVECKFRSKTCCFSLKKYIIHLKVLYKDTDFQLSLTVLISFSSIVVVFNLKQASTSLNRKLYFYSTLSDDMQGRSHIAAVGKCNNHQHMFKRNHSLGLHWIFEPLRSPSTSTGGVFTIQSKCNDSFCEDSRSTSKYPEGQHQNYETWNGKLLPTIMDARSILIYRFIEFIAQICDVVSGNNRWHFVENLCFKLLNIWPLVHSKKTRFREKNGLLFNSIIYSALSLTLFLFVRTSIFGVRLNVLKYFEDFSFKCF